MLSSACELLGDDLPLPAGSPGGMETYRQTLTTSFFFKFYLHVRNQLSQMSLVTSGIPPSHQSALGLYERPASKGVQVFEEPPKSQDDHDPIGRPLVHLSASKQATGEAKYVDDMPRHESKYIKVYRRHLVPQEDGHSLQYIINAFEFLSGVYAMVCRLMIHWRKQYSVIYSTLGINVNHISYY